MRDNLYDHYIVTLSRNRFCSTPLLRKTKLSGILYLIILLVCLQMTD